MPRPDPWKPTKPQPTSTFGHDGDQWQSVYSDAEGNLQVRNLILNTQSMEWEAATGTLSAGSSVTVVNFPASQSVDDGGGSLTVDGSLAISSIPGKATQLDWATATLMYKGWATQGTATSAASWAVMKRLFDAAGGYVETWADGNNTEDNIWDNRASLSYS